MEGAPLPRAGSSPTSVLFLGHLASGAAPLADRFRIIRSAKGHHEPSRLPTTPARASVFRKGVPGRGGAQYLQLVRSAPAGARLLTSSAHFNPNIWMYRSREMAFDTS